MVLWERSYRTVKIDSAEATGPAEIEEYYTHQIIPWELNADKSAGGSELSGYARTQQQREISLVKINSKHTSLW